MLRPPPHYADDEDEEWSTTVNKPRVSVGQRQTIDAVVTASSHECLIFLRTDRRLEVRRPATAIWLPDRNTLNRRIDCECGCVGRLRKVNRCRYLLVDCPSFRY
jgi:hypothetical protein